MSSPRLKDNTKNITDAELPTLSYFDGSISSIVVEGQPLYRGARRPFETIFPKGYKAWGNNLDILKHVIGAPLENFNPVEGFHDSAYIPTSSSKYQASTFPIAEHLPEGAKHTYLYEIHSSRPTININNWLSTYLEMGEIDMHAFLKYSAEKEFAFTNRIYPHEIKGGWRLKINNDLNTRVIDSPFVPNPHYKPPMPPSDVNKLLKTSKYLGGALTGVGVGLDLNSIYNQYQISKATGDYDNTYREGSRVAGGWAGAWLGGSTMAELSALACLPLSPMASAVCGVAGGLAGAWTGYTAGSEVGVKLYDVTRSKSCPITLGVFSSVAHASDLIEQDSEIVNMKSNQILPVYSDKNLKERLPDTLPRKASPIVVKPVPTFSTSEQAQDAVNNVHETLTLLAKAWAQDAHDISGFEREPVVIKLTEELRSLQLNKAPDKIIMEQVGKIKDAKYAITAERREFDYQLQGIEGFKDFVCAGALLAHKPQLAAQATALFSIGKHFSALTGFGGAAAMHPALAAGGIALGLVSLISSFNNKGEKEAAKAENEYKRAVLEILTCIRKELHERFDITDEKIDRLHADLTYYFKQNDLKQEQTLLMMKQQSEQNNKAYETTHQHLVTVQNKIDGLFTEVRNQQTMQEIRGITDPVRCSLNYVDIKPTPEQYKAWLSQFQLFIEQTTYSAPLTGAPHLPINVSGKLSSEALFAINTLAHYLDASLGRQPHQLLVAYSSLAVLRLIYLLNSSETKKIRRNEFDILLLINNKCDEIEKFITNLQAEKYATRLVDEYSSATLNIATVLPQTLQQIVQDKARHLNEALSLQLKIHWNEQAHHLATQAIDARIDYSQWFQAWTVTHYGTTEYYDNITTTNPRAAYLARRKQQLEQHKQITSQPVLKSDSTLSLLTTPQGLTLDINVEGLMAHPTLALMPEASADPVLSLRQGNGQLINLNKFFDIPKVCFEAIWLGVGQLRYRYRVENGVLRIAALLEMGGKTHEIRSASCPFSTGNYHRREGILWGWLGESVVNLQQAGPARWIGGTGKEKHWFLSYGMLPVISQSTPILHLFNEAGNKFNKAFEEMHMTNICLVRDAVKAKLVDLLKECEAALKLKCTTPDTTLAQGLSKLEASSQRLQAYAMLTLPDQYDNKNSSLNALQTLPVQQTVLDAFTLQNKSLITRGVLSRHPIWMDSAGYYWPQFCDTLRTVIVHVKGIPYLVTAIRDCEKYDLQLQNLQTKEIYRATGTQWTSKGGYDYPKYYETIRLNVINIAGIQHVVAMCRNASFYEVHFYNPEAKTWHYEAGPAWSDKAGYDAPEFYKTIRTEIVTIKNVQHLVVMIRNTACYEVHIFNPIIKSWKQISSVQTLGWTSAGGYNQPQFYETIRTAVVTNNGTDQLLFMTRHVGGYAITTYNVATEAWGSLKAPEWSDAKAYNKPEYYKAIRAEALNIASIAHVALLIRCQTHLELHLINTIKNTKSFYVGPAWSDEKGYNKPEFYDTIRTAVLHRNGQAYIAVMIRNASEYEMHVFDVKAKTWQVLPGWNAAASHANPSHHQTLRLQAMPVGYDCDFIAIVRDRNGVVFKPYSILSQSKLTNSHIILQENNGQYLLSAVKDQELAVQPGALSIANDLTNHLKTYNEKVKKPLLDLLRANQGKINNGLLTAVFAHIRDAKSFYGTRIDETGKYEDVFAESEATKKRFEEVSLLLNILVGAVSEENDPALRARLVERMQQKLSQQSLAGLNVFGLLAANPADKVKVEEVIDQKFKGGSIV